MRLEATPTRTEDSVGMAQVQSQLVALTVQLQEIAKQKEVRQNVWCTICHR